MKLNAYQKSALITVVITLAVIFTGGLVRASGSGLGCPDWPKCFGHWLPISSASQLPPGIDKSLFNPAHMWTEYINRLFGVATGIAIIITFILSFRYRKQRKSVFYASFAALLLVLFEGWIGGVVVTSALEVWLITIHMFLALATLLTLLYGTWRAFSEDFDFELDPVLRRKILTAVGILLAFTLIQVAIGTQVRQHIDVLKDSVNPPPRSQWLGMVGSIGTIHPLFSWTVVGAALYLAYAIKEFQPRSIYRRTTITILGLIVLQILLGLGLTRFDMFPPFQITHMINSILLVCAEFLLLLFSYAAHGRKKGQPLVGVDSFSGS